MESNPLLQQIKTMKQSLMDEGILSSQFTEVESLSSDEEPNFAQDLINLHFEESKKTIAIFEEKMAITPIDYSVLVLCIDKLRGASVSVGASKMRIEVDLTIECCKQENFEGARAALERLKAENETFKAKMDTYFGLVKQAKDPK